MRSVRSRFSLLLLVASAVSSAHALPATATTLTVSGSSVAAGTSVLLTATVKNASGPLTPGQVAFCDVSRNHVCTGASANMLGLAQLTSTGTALFKYRPGPGVHALAARFLGTTTDSASTSVNVSLTVTTPAGLIPTQTILTTYAETTGGGNPEYQLTANVGALLSAGAPTGSVNFQVASTPSVAVTTATLASAPMLTNTFGPGPAPGIPNTTGTVAVGDFNEDGIPDLVTVEQYTNPTSNATSYSVGVLPGVGDGSFQAASASNTFAALCPSTCMAAATGDFNADGHVDLVTIDVNAKTGAQSLQFGYGQGNGKVTAGPSYPLISSPTWSQIGTEILVGDFNGDGRADLAVYDATNGNLAIALQQASGSYVVSYSTVFSAAMAGGYPSIPVAPLVAGDFNADGKTDLAGVGAGTASLVVATSNGEGGFSASAYDVESLSAGIAAGDFDGDGIADIAVNGQGFFVYILYGGSGGTQYTFQLPENYSVTSLSAVDANGDGIEDLLAVNTSYLGGSTSSYSFEILGASNRTATEAGFNPSTSFIAISNPPVLTGTIAVDLNGDGYQDLLPIQGTCCAEFLSNGGLSFSSASVNQVSIPVSGGPVPLVAAYPGQGSYAASTSASVPVYGNPIADSLQLFAVPGSDGQSAQVTAVLSAGGQSVVSTNGERILFGTEDMNSGTVYSTLENGAAGAGLDLPPGGGLIFAEYFGDGNFALTQASVNVSFSSAANLSGAFTFYFHGKLPPNGTVPQGVAGAGSFVADGGGNIVSGVEDVNSGSGVYTASALHGTYTVNPDGTGILHLINAQGVAQDFSLVLFQGGGITTLGLLSIGDLGEVVSGSAVSTSSANFSSANLTGSGFELQLDGETACQNCAADKHGAGAVSVLGVLSLVDVAAYGQGTVAENLAGRLVPNPYLPLTLTAPDPTTGRFTLVDMSTQAPPDQPRKYAGYIVDATHAFVVSLDPHSSAILLSGTLVHQY